MPNKKQGKPIAQTWWGKHQPFTFLLCSIPSISGIQRRWAFFQIILSLIFFCFAITIGVLTIDISTVSGGIMIIAVIFFMLGLFGLTYAFWIGSCWFYPKYPINKDDEAKRVERDDRLHDDIHSLIQEMRQDRYERNKKTKT